MRIPRKPTTKEPDFTGLVAAVRGEVAGVEADAFDEALAAAVEGLAEALQAEAAALAELQGKARRRARR